MALDLSIVDQLNNTINVARRTGARAEFGDPTFAAPAERKVRWEPKLEVVETTPGNFRQTTHWFLTDILIEMGDRVFDPGKNPATDSPRIPVTIDEGVDEDGVTCFWEVRV